MPSSSLPVNDGYWNMLSPCENSASAANPSRIGASPRSTPTVDRSARASVIWSGQVRTPIALATGAVLLALEDRVQRHKVGDAPVCPGVRRLLPGVHAAKLTPDRA